MTAVSRVFTGPDVVAGSSGHRLMMSPTDPIPDDRIWGIWGLATNSQVATIATNAQNEMKNRAVIKQANAMRAGRRFDVAQEAHSEGNVELASLLFRRTLSSRTATPEMKKIAAEAFGEYSIEANREIARIKLKIERIFSRHATSDEPGDEREKPLRLALGELKDLQARFQNVPHVDERLTKELDSLLHQDGDVADVLYEPTALRIVEHAREMERDGQTCCAFVWYEEAAKLLPCRSAKYAKKRIEELSKDRELVRQVDVCRQIRVCQEQFDRAIQASYKKGDANKGLAKSMFEKIVKSAPEDSEVHKAARRELEHLEKQG